MYKEWKKIEFQKMFICDFGCIKAERKTKKYMTT